MENLYILLELPFDPAENDPEKIKAAIAKKQAQWSRDQLNPIKKAKASEYLAHLEEIKRIMLDPSERAKQAEEAKQIKQGKLKELKEKLGLYRAKGDTLSERDLNTLVKNFGPYGYTAQEITKLFDSLGGKEEKIDPSQVLNITEANNIKTLMRQLESKPKTLYDFLGLRPTASCAQLCDAANAMKRKILAKGEKTGQDNAAQSLCGLCLKVFKDAASKQKYDNYVNLTKYERINEAIDELAIGNKKRIEPKMKESIIDIAVQNYSLSVSDASVYINQYCEYMGYALPDNKIVCGLCGAENPAGTINCVKCGKPLIIICPSCGAENNNSAKNCAKCGFDLTQMDKAVEMLREAKQKFAEKAFDEADRLVKEAKVYWPNHPDIPDLEKSISDERKRASELIAAIMKDVQEKRIYAARTKIDQAKTSGFAVDAQTERKVSDTIAEVERQLALMRSASGDAAFNIAMKLVDLISDSEELNRSLKNFPPQEPQAITCTRSGDRVTLSWKASSSVGEILYQLVRKENAYPNSPEDGVKVYAGKELTFTDSTVPKNKTLYYAVFALRIGVYSKATRLSETVAIVDKVTKLRAIGGDGMVTLSWDRSPTVTEVRVMYCKGFQRSERESDYRDVPCARLDELLVKDLENGQNYWFAVSAGHTINGKIYYSEKTYIAAVPQKPAQPLQDFSVRLQGDVFMAEWAKSEWDVILLYSKQKPDYVIGTIYDLDELLQKFEKIDINLKSMTEAEFKLNFIGECYIIPGVINASNVILNTAAYISSVPPVKEVSYDLNNASTELYINFTWPKKIERVLMVYRMDSYPSGIDDPLAQKVECTKRQYETNEGILMNNPPSGTLYAEIYAYVDAGDHRIYSDPCRALIRNEPQKDVIYTLQYKKAGLFSKKCTLTVEITLSGDCTFPKFAIIGKFKSTPLNRSDGEIICTMDTETEVSKSYAFKFDVSPIRAETRLKMFFLADKSYKSFRITCKAGNIV